MPAIDNVIAIKVAPFNRYKTLDVAFGVVAAGAEERITLYTGNDDHIVADLVTPLRMRTGKREATLRFQGGLLGHWSVWTQRPSSCWSRLEACVGRRRPGRVLALDSMVTDCNSVIFDVDNDFAGCIPGCHEVLRRQGLMRTIHCLDPNEVLSPGQTAGIDRLYATYPELNDDAFVAANLERWRGSHLPQSVFSTPRASPRPTVQARDATGPDVTKAVSMPGSRSRRSGRYAQDLRTGRGTAFDGLPDIARGGALTPPSFTLVKVAHSWPGAASFLGSRR